MLHLSTSAERAEEATSCLLDEWHRCLQEPPASRRELALALAKLRGQDAMGRQTCCQIADRQALVLSHGSASGPRGAGAGAGPAARSEDLLAAAQRWLRPPCLSLVGPAPALAGGGAAWRRIHRPAEPP